MIQTLAAAAAAIMLLSAASAALAARASADGSDEELAGIGALRGNPGRPEASNPARNGFAPRSARSGRQGQEDVYIGLSLKIFDSHSPLA